MHMEFEQSKIRIVENTQLREILTIRTVEPFEQLKVRTVEIRTVDHIPCQNYAISISEQLLQPVLHIFHVFPKLQNCQIINITCVLFYANLYSLQVENEKKNCSMLFSLLEILNFYVILNFQGQCTNLYVVKQMYQLDRQKVQPANKIKLKQNCK
eukprot:TRINITY_DN4829_c0_g1_i12.p4 TRINITY_DN4829_c0_g1~~TRINITY_DN4829_c0_g1_i12.p4  ORF type:complete len:155 (+),score=0.06 TRINITY_DN4829_c0_g1_i12:266-730(+)